MGVGAFQLLSPVGNKFNFVLIFPLNSASFIFGVLERTGRKWNSEDSSCRPRLFRAHPEGSFQARYSGYDGAVWIDCQVFNCHWWKWSRTKIFCSDAAEIIPIRPVRDQAVGMWSVPIDSSFSGWFYSAWALPSACVKVYSLVFWKWAQTNSTAFQQWGQVFHWKTGRLWSYPDLQKEVNQIHFKEKESAFIQVLIEDCHKQNGCRSSQLYRENFSWLFTWALLVKQSSVRAECGMHSLPAKQVFPLQVDELLSRRLLAPSSSLPWWRTDLPWKLLRWNGQSSCMGDVVRGPYFPGNDFLFKCTYKSCDDELELFMPVNSGINLSGDVSQPMKNWT